MAFFVDNLPEEYDDKEKFYASLEREIEIRMIQEKDVFIDLTLNTRLSYIGLHIRQRPSNTHCGFVKWVGDCNAGAVELINNKIAMIIVACEAMEGNYVESMINVEVVEDNGYSMGALLSSVVINIAIKQWFVQ